ncbi:hypothetical protein HUO09_17585 [Vibrio sp. Y2-5]|uniref:hypothetical protein n=1 Tax=Vibrio sp. Y2-5 TaxID=2743977 RepID=UPI0016616D8B|nr:hypothetical protein [Vibrio sp. Y2-5]MBD0788170.1 hypothetical protein [Vibrio sp. Y2-5]
MNPTIELFRTANHLDALLTAKKLDATNELTAFAKQLKSYLEVEIDLEGLVDIPDYLSHWEEGTAIDLDKIKHWPSMVINSLNPHLSDDLILVSGWAVAEDTMTGIFIGTTDSELTGLGLPVIFRSESDAKADLQTMVADCQEEISNGERDEDDEFQGYVVPVQILKSGEIYFPENGRRYSMDVTTGLSNSQYLLSELRGFTDRNFY